MKKLIVDETRPVTLLGGGRPGPQDLEESLSLAPVLVAADGGATLALSFGKMPEAVIGDFDSISAQSLAQIPQSHRFLISEQETTDFDKALRAIKAPIVLGVGFLGGRLDHQLAALNVLVRHAEQPCILLSEHEITFHVSRPLKLDLKQGDTVSLFPLSAVRAVSEGLEWPLEGLLLEPDGFIGTSNRATGPIRLEAEGAGLLAMIPRHYLQELMRALIA